MDGETTVKGDDFVLEQEFEVVARCLLHGKDHISMRPIIRDLGHGRATIDMGRAYCRGTGCNSSSRWITLDLFLVKWDKVPKAEWNDAMRQVLVAEMGAPKPAAEEEEEEVIKPVQPEPQSESIQTRAISRPSLGDRPRL